MTPAVEIIDGYLVIKHVMNSCLEEQGNAVHFTVNQLYITDKMEHFNFKSGHAKQ